MITGFSGAGKSTAMNVFEDAGYFCVDNLPPEMIRSLVELFAHERLEGRARGDRQRRARRRVLRRRCAPCIEGLPAMGVRHRVLFLDADEDTLLNRYKETRSRHPVTPHGSIAAGIASERTLLEPLKELADAVVDTSGLKASTLRRRIADEFLPHQETLAAGGHVPELRLQARAPARRRPRLRRPVPAQPALGAVAARADRARPAGPRVRRARRQARGVLRRASSRCSTSCCRSTRPRARRTSRSRSAAPAVVTARWPSPSTSRSAIAGHGDLWIEVAHRDVTKAPERA